MDGNRAVFYEGGEIEIRIRGRRFCRQSIVSLQLAKVIFDEDGCMEDSRGQSLNACDVLRPRKQANIVSSDINPVIGKKCGSDGLHGVFMSGDREKNDPLSVQCEGISECVKSFGLNGYQNTRSIVVPGRVVSPLQTHLHFSFSLSHSFF